MQNTERLTRGRPIEVPYRSDNLSRALGIAPPAPGLRHTAEHDTKWVIALFDSISSHIPEP